MTTVLILSAVFVLLLIGNVPISVSIALATLAAMLPIIDFGPAVTTIAARMAGGIDSFTLLAIPLFVLSGQIMSRGGIARRLIEAAKALVGMVPGGLAFVNVLSSMLFGAISGSAVATTSAIGSFMIPEMNKAGYPKGFNGAITAAASTTGLLIPPSNTLIVYAVASGGVSISALFMAGYFPGVLLGFALMLACGIGALRSGLRGGERIALGPALRKLVDAVPSLLLLVIVIGGILSGMFTPTEAGAVAVVYALLLAVGLYRELRLAELPDVVLKSAETTAVVMLLIGTSTALGWILTYNNIPAIASDALLGLSGNPIVILLLMNLILLVVGAFLDLTPAVLIFTPIFLPVAVEMGLSPVHFGIMLILNLSIGLCTPPVGSVLFVSCAVARMSIGQIIRPMLPLYLAMIAVLIAVIVAPEISEWLPRQLGLIE